MSGVVQILEKRSILRSLIFCVLMIISVTLSAQTEKKFIRKGNREYEKDKYSDSEISYKKLLIRISNIRMLYLMSEMRFINRISLKKQANNLLKAPIRITIRQRNQLDYITLEIHCSKPISFRNV